MQLYAAPLEGITGYVFRNAFCKCFDNVDKYFIPFIQPNQKGHFSSREKQDVTPELEGITGYVFRNAFCKCFDNVDKYFIPFIQPNQKGHFSSREKQDVTPENNQGMYAVPQILTNSSEDFLRTAWKLKKTYGYQEVNLNLGCPSKTVISKKRGSGFLAYPEELKEFLAEIFENTEVEISIKWHTRKN